eukprot:1824223-Pyramimonas_sp.AAC.1
MEAAGPEGHGKACVDEFFQGVPTAGVLQPRRSARAEAQGKPSVLAQHEPRPQDCDPPGHGTPSSSSHGRHESLPERLHLGADQSGGIQSDGGGAQDGAGEG